MSENRNVLITGVSSGIGLGLAQFYLNNGWNVYGVSRRTPPAEVAEHSAFQFETLDLCDEASVQPTLARLLADAGELQLAILNAGVLGRVADMKELALAEMREVMNVNVWANKTVIDAILSIDIVVSQIVTISSGAAVNGNRGWGGYSISKAALNMLTRLYAKENPDVHFAAVAPGLVDTAMQDVLCSMTEQVEQFPSLGVLQSKRGGPEMPNPDSFAPRFAAFVQSLPERIESGDFIDIRKA